MVSHAGHDHPATSAARAACRRAGGTPEAMVEAPQKAAKARSPRTPSVGTPHRRITSTGDLGGLAVPHVFGNVIRHAWGQEWDVRTGDTYTDDQRTVVISSDHGWLTLTWRGIQPMGVSGVSYRPKGTSVWTKLATINDGIRALDGHWLDGDA
jgi:hypothetical protein